jgi:RluA family pseudouridine synthase
MANTKPPARRHPPRGVELIYEDDDLLVVDKPAGLLTVPTATEKVKTAHAAVTEYIRKGSGKSRRQMFTVHRLDQWTSGVLIFAKSQDIKDRLQSQWADTEKIYAAIVHGTPVPPEGVITSYLVENERFVMYSTPDPTKGKLAKTGYKVVKSNALMSLLKIDLLTGRKNQIRIQMAEKGHPVVGDRKYGKDRDNCRRLALHSESIRFAHPVGGQSILVQAPVPLYFKELMAGKSSTLR